MTDYGILVMGPGGEIRIWTDGAARLFRYEAAEIVGQPLAVIFTPEDRAQRVPEQLLHQATVTGRAAEDRYHVRKDGSRFFASGFFFPLHKATGELGGFVKICRDLTERKQWEQTLHEEREQLEHRIAERTEQLSGQLAERRHSEKRVRGLLSHLTTLQEEERRRIARDLHDHLGQQITALHLQLDLLKQDLTASSAGKRSTNRLELVKRLFTQLDRDLDFFTRELRPTTLYNLGLVPALADYITAFSNNFDLPVSFEVVGLNDVRLDRNVEINLYRIAQEALTNTYKHGKASRADVVLRNLDGTIVLTVTDDGVGFSADLPEAPDRGMGLDGMKERAALVGGTLEIKSGSNQGTSVIATLPFRSSDRIDGPR